MKKPAKALAALGLLTALFGGGVVSVAHDHAASTESVAGTIGTYWKTSPTGSKVY